MREVRDLATGMREILTSLRKDNADAKSELELEVTRAKGNAEKVKSFTKDLKEANLEVEAMLGETGSNFPTSESSTLRQSGHVTTDLNGVTRNQG